MGIPRLTTHLEPYLHRATLGCSNADCKGCAVREHKVAVIDGPGLAYHVFHKLLGRNGAQNALEAQPTYDEVNRAVVIFLEILERSGFQIKYVLFDGALPTSKRPIRLSRLEGILRQLISFRTLHANGFKLSNLERCEVKSTSLFYPRISSSLGKALPAPPFLVPSVFEALQLSKYADATTLVPGEADPYLAAATRRTTDAILITGDSDLAIHDLGAGKLAFLASVDLQPCSACNQGQRVSASLMHQRSLIEKFGQHATARDLVDAGFEIFDDPYVTFAEASRRVRDRKAGRRKARMVDPGGRYSDFAADYIQDVDLMSIKTVPAWSQQLDNRVSELVLQMLKRDEPSPCVMYLLPLVEDPERASAWSPGREMRRLAYSVLAARLDSRMTTVCEFGRSGVRVMPQTINLISELNMAEELKDIDDQLNRIKGYFQLESQSLIWTMLAVVKIYIWHLEEGKTPPSDELLEATLGRRRTGKVTWQSVHLLAQIHGFLYSLRILAQSLRKSFPDTEAPLTSNVTPILTRVPRITEIILFPGDIAAKGLFDHVASVVKLAKAVRQLPDWGDESNEQIDIVGMREEESSQLQAVNEAPENEESKAWQNAGTSSNKAKKRKRRNET